MRELTGISAVLADYGGMTRIEFAKLLMHSASAIGLNGRRGIISDEMVRQMWQGLRDDDPRLQQVVLHALTENHLVPWTNSILSPAVAVDVVTCAATAVLAEKADQEDWMPVLAQARLVLIPIHERFEAYVQQADLAFPEAIAGAPADSFYGLVWRGGVWYIYAACCHALHDLADEVRYQLSCMGVTPTLFVRDCLEEIEAIIEVSGRRVLTLDTLAKNFNTAAISLEKAARRCSIDNHRDFCQYVAAKARANVRALRAEIKEVAAGQRRYGGFDKEAVEIAKVLDQQHERQMESIPARERLTREKKDVLWLTRLQPHDHRPSRSIIYEAIRDQDVSLLRELLPVFAATINLPATPEKLAFHAVPPRAPQTLPLIEEPGLQDAYKSCAELAELAGWRPDNGKPSDGRQVHSNKVLLVAGAVAFLCLGARVEAAGYESWSALNVVAPLGTEQAHKYALVGDAIWVNQNQSSGPMIATARMGQLAWQDFDEPAIQVASRPGIERLDTNVQQVSWHTLDIYKAALVGVDLPSEAAFRPGIERILDAKVQQVAWHTLDKASFAGVDLPSEAAFRPGIERILEATGQQVAW